MEATAQTLPNPILAAARCKAPTISELLADPMTRAVMKADRVDARAMEKMLRSQARKLEARGSRETRGALAEYARWREIEGLPEPAAAPSMHDVIAARVLGSPLGWLGTW